MCRDECIYPSASAVRHTHRLLDQRQIGSACTSSKMRQSSLTEIKTKIALLLLLSTCEVKNFTAVYFHSNVQQNVKTQWLTPGSSVVIEFSIWIVMFHFNIWSLNTVPMVQWNKYAYGPFLDHWKKLSVGPVYVMYCPVTDDKDLADMACSRHCHRLPKLLRMPDCTIEQTTSSLWIEGFHELSRTHQSCLPYVGTRRHFF